MKKISVKYVKYRMKGLTARRRLELQTGLLVAFALLTVTVMSSYMDQGREAAPVSGEAVSADGLGGAANPEIAVPANQYDGIIRMHVIANSDSEEDQDLKLKVRNQVLAKIQNHLADCFAQEMIRSGREQLDDETRMEITRNYITEHLDEIETWAADAIEAEGADYPVTAELGVTWIPEKVYDDICFPAGNYEALNITIGEGAGQNWWCVIFPPLCLIDCGDSIYKERMQDGYSSRVVLKSRILEILENNTK